MAHTERVHGLTYTNLSKIQKAFDIGIMNSFTWASLLKKIANHANTKLRTDIEKKLNKIEKDTARKLCDMSSLNHPQIS